MGLKEKLTDEYTTEFNGNLQVTTVKFLRKMKWGKREYGKIVVNFKENLIRYEFVSLPVIKEIIMHSDTLTELSELPEDISSWFKDKLNTTQKHMFT